MGTRNVDGRKRTAHYSMFGKRLETHRHTIDQGEYLILMETDEDATRRERFIEEGVFIFIIMD